jgi:MFS family permease
MDPNLRLLGLGTGIRTFGLTFIGPFAALYLLNVAHVGFVTIGLVLAAIAVPPLLWSPYAGILADRLGRHRLLIATFYGEAAAVGLLAVAISERSTALFIAALALTSMAATTGGPAWSAYVADLAVGSERTLGFTWLRIGSNFGFASGVALGGFLVGTIGFLDATEVSTVLILLASTLLLLRLRPTPYDLALRARGGREPSLLPVGSRSPGGVGRVLKDRRFLLTSLGFGLAVLATNQWNTTYALFAGHSLGLSYVAIGAGFALNGVLVVVGQSATTHAVLGRSHTSIGAYGTLCYVAGFLLLGAAPFLGVSVLGVFLAATAIITLGENLITIPISTLPSNLAAPEAIGLYNGAFSMVLGVGSLLSTAVGGVVLAYVANPLEIWGLLVLPAVPAILLLRRAGTQLPARSNLA